MTEESKLTAPAKPAPIIPPPVSAETKEKAESEEAQLSALAVQPNDVYMQNPRGK